MTAPVVFISISLMAIGLLISDFFLKKGLNHPGVPLAHFTDERNRGPGIEMDLPAAAGSLPPDPWLHGLLRRERKKKLFKKKIAAFHLEVGKALFWGDPSRHSALLPIEKAGFKVSVGKKLSQQNSAGWPPTHPLDRPRGPGSALSGRTVGSGQ